MRDYTSVSKFLRGQVWNVREENDITDAKIKHNDRVIAYSRPYIIMQDTSYIDNPSTLLCIPVTSKLCERQENAEIIFRNAEYEQNKAVIYQIQSKDVKFFTKYLYTISDDLMEDIEKIVKNIMGLNKEEIRIQKEIDEEIKHQMITEKVNKFSNIFSSKDDEGEDDIKIIPIEEEIKEEEKPVIDEPVVVSPLVNELDEIIESLSKENKENKKEDKPKKRPTNKKLKITKTKVIKKEEKPKMEYMKWTDSLMREFVNDCENMSFDDMSIKWNMDIERIKRRRLYCYHKLGLVLPVLK